MRRHASLLCRASLLCLAAALALAPDAASARGGSRGGRAGARAAMHGVSPQGQSVTVPGAVNQTAVDPPAGTTRLAPGAAGAIENAVAPPPAPTTPAAAPNSAAATPADRLLTIAPLSQPIQPQALSPGGAATLSSSSPLSTSPSQAAPSIAGGGGNTLGDCMRFWDKATHMSKSEWQAACERSLHRLDSVARELAPTRGAMKAR